LAKGPARDEGAVTVGTADLEAGLDLLAAEQKATPEVSRHVLLIEIVEDLAFGISCISGLFGVLTIGSDRTWGLGLLGIAFVALVVFAALPRSGLNEATNKMVQAIEAAGSGKATEAVKRHKRTFNASDAGVILGLLGTIASVVWLLIGLIGDGSVRPLAIALGGVSTVGFWSSVGQSVYRDYRYYTHLAATHQELTGRLSEATSQNREEVEVSRDQLDVLAEAETHQTARAVKAAVEEASGLDSAWGVTIMPEAKTSLDELAEREPEAWTRVVKAINRLQDDPRPPAARPTTGPDVVELDAGPCKVDYSLEQKAHRVYVLAIEEEAQGASDA
jgi:hypothetical protein